MVHPADRIARRITQALQLKPESHQLMEENLAAYVSHLKPDFQDRLERTDNDSLLFTLRQGYANGEQRWTQKLLRDVEHPYSDGQVQQRFEKLEARFQDEGKRLKAEHLGAYPCQTYVMGSVVKGRFGAHSDIDCLAVTKTGDYRPGSYGDVAWQLTEEGGKDFYLKSFGEAVEVDPSQPRPVLNAYREGLRNKGLELLIGADGSWQVQRFSYPQRSPEPQPKTAMMWSFSDLP